MSCGPAPSTAAGLEARTGRLPDGRRAYFLFGCLAYLIALSPPLDDWSDFYLLTAHMFQHMIVIFVVAPLLAGRNPGLGAATAGEYPNREQDRLDAHPAVGGRRRLDGYRHPLACARCLRCGVET